MRVNEKKIERNEVERKETGRKPDKIVRSTVV